MTNRHAVGDTVRGAIYPRRRDGPGRSPRPPPRGDQGLFQFLIDVENVDLRQETIQQQLFDSKARDATIVVVADVHSLGFTRAATSLTEALSGALADLKQVLPGAVVVFITIEQSAMSRFD
jgi:hypothetical protein